MTHRIPVQQPEVRCFFIFVFLHGQILKQGYDEVIHGVMLNSFQHLIESLFLFCPRTDPEICD